MKITIIGAGNMGGAIALGLASSGKIEPEDITVINRSAEKIEAIKLVNRRICGVVKEYDSIKTANIIILAVKPWLIEEVLTAHRSKLNNKQLIISIAAGISLEQLEAWTPLETPLFRVMPNTAIAIKTEYDFLLHQVVQPKIKKHSLSRCSMHLVKPN